MKIIEIKTQAELDALPDSFLEYTEIRILGGTRYNRIVVSKAWGNSSVVARDNSSVVARENSSVVALDNSSVVARENSSVEAWENSSVEAWGNSSVVAWNNSSVVAWNNSSVVARDNSSVVAWGNSSVVARDNSSVVARENSSVVARDNSSVEAWENSSVEAWGNSSVEAWGNSSVVARNNSSVHGFDCSFVVIFGSYVVVKRLYDYSTAVFRNRKANIEDQHETVTVKEVTDKMLDRSFEEELSRGYVKADGIIKKLVSKKKIGDIEVFEVSDFPKKTNSYVVKRGDHFSHGETIEKAIEDLRFKISDRDTSKFNHWKNTDSVVSLDEAISGYRVITGACETGTKSFVNDQGVLPDKLSIKEIIEKTKGQYGSKNLLEFCGVN